MLRKDIERAISFGLTAEEKRTTAGFITKTQLARVMGISDIHKINKYLDGLEAIDGKYYLIPMVAEKLQRRCHE